MRLACALVATLAGAVLSAQTARDTVTLDVLVDAADARGALVASDFTVADGDEQLVVEGASLILASSDQAPLPAVDSREDELRAAAQAARLVAVYIDEYHVADGEAFRAARAALAAFIRALGPRDLVVVRKPLDSLVTIRMTSDHDAAARTVEAAEAREGDYAPRSPFEQQFLASAPPRIEAARQQIVVSSLSALTAHLGSLAGDRKTLMILSNGFPLKDGDVRGDRVSGVETIVRTANRERVAIYGLRPSAGGPPAVSDAGAAGRESRELLAAVAAPTSGFVVEGADAAAEGLERMLRDASRYYLLSVRPNAAIADGRLRPLRVQGLRGDAVVRARESFGLHREALPAFVPRSTVIPEGLKVPRRTSPLIRTWFGQSAGDGGRTRVAFVWEPAPLVPGRGGATPVPSRVSLSVTTMDGASVFRGVVSASGREQAAATTRPLLAFDAIPSTLLVQMEVLDIAGRVLDRDARDLVVNAFAGAVSFGTPSVFRARSARELRVIDDGEVAPVASRLFSRAEHLVVRIPVAGAGAAATVRARLQSRFGADLRQLPVRVGVGDAGAVQVDVALAGLASGGYAVAFEAPAERATAVARVEFSVTP